MIIIQNCTKYVICDLTIQYKEHPRITSWVLFFIEHKKKVMDIKNSDYNILYYTIIEVMVKGIKYGNIYRISNIYLWVGFR